MRSIKSRLDKLSGVFEPRPELISIAVFFEFEDDQTDLGTRQRVFESQYTEKDLQWRFREDFVFDQLADTPEYTFHVVIFTVNQDAGPLRITRGTSSDTKPNFQLV